MDRRGKDGSSLRDHAEAIQQRLGRWPAGIPQEPPFPLLLTYLWGWFGEVSSGRTTNGLGLNVLSWSDLYAWCSLMRRRPEVWELACIRELDRELIRSIAEAKD